MGVDAGLTDDNPVIRNQCGQGSDLIKIHGKGSQIAVVDTDNSGVEFYRSCDFVLMGCFGKNSHPQTVGKVPKLSVGFIGKHGKHQQYCVGFVVSCQIYLVRIEDEVLAEYRNIHRCAYLGNVFVSALEERFIGQYGNGAGVVAVNRSYFNGIKYRSDKPL